MARNSHWHSIGKSFPNVAVAALNLIYQPEWTRFVGTGAAEQEATIGAALGVMARLRPGVLPRR